MSDFHSILGPSAPFTRLSIAPLTGGVIVVGRDGLGLATMLARRGKSVALSQRVHKFFGIDLPLGPRRVTVGNVALCATAPGAWLATLEGGGNGFAVSLKEELGDLASLSDQSDGYCVLRLCGPKVRDVLAKLFSIDLHPRTFKPGDVAVTAAAHIGATLWRLDDDGDGAVVFDVAVFRSLAASFSHVLAQSAAEFA